MTSSEIDRVVRLMERYGLEEFEYQSETAHIRLVRPGATPSASPVFPAAGISDTPSISPVITGHDVIASPGVGRFLLDHPAMSEDGASLPRRVSKGEIVAYVEAGDLLRPVNATSDCILLQALVHPGKGVGYGEPLFQSKSL